MRSSERPRRGGSTPARVAGPPSAHPVEDRCGDAIDREHRRVFQLVGRGQWNVLRGDPDDRTVEIIETLLCGDRGDLGAPAAFSINDCGTRRRISRASLRVVTSRASIWRQRHSGEEGTVARAEPRLPGLPSKHLQLVAKDQDLDVLGAGVAGACNEAGEHATTKRYNQVEDEGHLRILRIRRLRGGSEFSRPTACSSETIQHRVIV
jgi:hypothetical protein